MAAVGSVVKFASAADLAQIDHNGDLKKNENVKTFQEFILPKFYVFNLLFSIVTFVVDLYLHCRLAYFYSKTNQGMFFALTLIFLVMPALVSTAFSMRWYLVDEDELNTAKRPRLWQRWTLRLVMLFLQMAPLLRWFSNGVAVVQAIWVFIRMTVLDAVVQYCDALYYGIRSKISKRQENHLKHQQYLRLMFEEDCDSSLLRLFYSFLQSCPQATIHMVYILLSLSNSSAPSTSTTTITTTASTIDWQPYSIVWSLVAVAWSLTSYYRSHRAILEDKDKLTLWASTVMFAWFFFNTFSRVLALSFLATIFPRWLIVFCIVHWAVMFLWLVLGKQTTVCISHCEELVLCAALAVAYIFAFISPKKGPTRYSYLAYYLVTFIENTAILVIWCVVGLGPNAFRFGAVSLQMLAFVLNVVLMATYYKFCHPTGTSLVIRQSMSLTMPKGKAVTM